MTGISICGITKAETEDFITRNIKWHKENNIGPPSAFAPNFIEKFTSKVSEDYKIWLKELIK